MARHFSVALFLIVLVAVAVTGPTMLADSSDKPQQDELQKVQGRWEWQLSEQEKSEGLRRVVKEITGNREKVSYFGENDKVLRVHTVDFEVEKSGPFHVFTFHNMEVIDGPGKGQKFAGPYSYVYRVDDESFYEVEGIFPGQEQQPVQVRHWKRVKL